MTTIAWDGTTVAADRQISYHCAPALKIMRLRDGSVVGASGEDYGRILSIFDALNSGAYPDSADVQTTILHVHPNGTATLWLTRGKPIPVSAPFAIGSGADYAMGAMSMGAFASHAVEIASRFDPSTGAGVDVVTVRSDEA